MTTNKRITLDDARQIANRVEQCDEIRGLLAPMLAGVDDAAAENFLAMVEGEFWRVSSGG